MPFMEYFKCNILTSSFIQLMISLRSLIFHGPDIIASVFSLFVRAPDAWQYSFIDFKDSSIDCLSVLGWCHPHILRSFFCSRVYLDPVIFLFSLIFSARPSAESTNNNMLKGQPCVTDLIMLILLLVVLFISILLYMFVYTLF